MLLVSNLLIVLFFLLLICQLEIIVFCNAVHLYQSFICNLVSLRTSETNYLNEAFSFYSAIRVRAYYSKASKEER